MGEDSLCIEFFILLLTCNLFKIAKEFNLFHLKKQIGGDAVLALYAIFLNLLCSCCSLRYPLT